jgi:transposase-like protein
MSQPKRPQDWSVQEKWELVLETEGLEGEQLGALLRRRGVHQVQLERWRDAMRSALEAPRSRPSRGSSQTRRIRELEKELGRKDKALAETAALLVLKKKVQAIWGDEDDDT